MYLRDIAEITVLGAAVGAVVGATFGAVIGAMAVTLTEVVPGGGGNPHPVQRCFLHLLVATVGAVVGAVCIALLYGGMAVLCFVVDFFFVEVLGFPADSHVPVPSGRIETETPPTGSGDAQDETTA